MSARGIPLHKLAWACALLPLVTTHTSYLLAASAGHVDWCIPYWDSCTSISATGRQLPEKLVFKLGMIPASMVSMLLWWSLVQWLPDHRQQIKSDRAILILGSLSALFLMLYTTALGEEGEAYQRLRRIGITLSFAFTFLTQLICTRQLIRVPETIVHHWRKRLLWLLSCLLAIGIMTVILDAALGPRYDAMENAFEWIMALMLNAWFAGMALMLGRLESSLTISR